VSRCGGGGGPIGGSDVKTEPTEGGITAKAEPQPDCPSEAVGDDGDGRDLRAKRPALPAKDYEEEEEEQGDKLQSVYDYKLLNAWLSHPVKKFKGTGSDIYYPVLVLVSTISVN
jgi:hypothetical protein